MGRAAMIGDFCATCAVGRSAGTQGANALGLADRTLRVMNISPYAVGLLSDRLAGLAHRPPRYLAPFNRGPSLIISGAVDPVRARARKTST